jgi:phosphonate transport system permease protein
MKIAEFKISRYKNIVLPLGGLTFLTFLAFKSCKIDFSDFGQGLLNGTFFLSRMFPPDWTAFPEMIQPTFDTLMLAFLGTVFGTILSLFVAFFASANISNRWIRNITRSLISIERSIPELFILLILITAFGLGTIPAIIAIALGCVGMLGKLLADTIEDIPPTLMESVASIGANKLQIITFAVLPEILPNLISYALFRFEVNIRLSVLLGAIGAGGIGYELENSFSLLEYHRAFSALIIVLVLVFSIERLSSFLRNKLKNAIVLK